MAQRVKSTKPSAVKKRLRRKLEKLDDVTEELELLYQKPIEEWTFEELQAGRPVNPRTGELLAKRPAWITPAIMTEAQRRLRSMTASELGRYAGAAIQVMSELMVNARSDMVKYKAAEYVLNQIMGMPTQRVETEQSVSIQSFLADVIRNPDGNEVRVIEGSVSGDDDGEDDDDE